MKIELIHTHDPRILSNINVILPNIPYYGDFLIKEIVVWDNDDGKKDIPILKFKANDSEMIEMNKYLCGYGFAERRYDIDGFGNYIQLTDKGRKLKHYKSIEEFKKFFRLEQSEIQFRNKMVEYNYWIAVSIALSTFVAAVYYFCQLYDSVHTHPYIAITTAGIYVGALLILILYRYLPRMNKKARYIP